MSRNLMTACKLTVIKRRHCPLLCNTNSFLNIYPRQGYISAHHPLHSCFFLTTGTLGCGLGRNPHLLSGKREGHSGSDIHHSPLPSEILTIAPGVKVPLGLKRTKGYQQGNEDVVGGCSGNPKTQNRVGFTEGAYLFT